MEKRHFAKVSFLSAEFSRRQDSYPQVVWSSQGAEQSRGTYVFLSYPRYTSTVCVFLPLATEHGQCMGTLADHLVRFGTHVNQTDPTIGT